MSICPSVFAEPVGTAGVVPVAGGFETVVAGATGLAGVGDAGADATGVGTGVDVAGVRTGLAVGVGAGVGVGVAAAGVVAGVVVAVLPIGVGSGKSAIVGAGFGVPA